MTATISRTGIDVGILIPPVFTATSLLTRLVTSLLAGDRCEVLTSEHTSTILRSELFGFVFATVGGLGKDGGMFG